MQLCETIQSTPQTCKCGDAAAHLEGHCRCCLAKNAENAGKGLSCSEILSKLQADLNLFGNDFMSISAPLMTVLHSDSADSRRELLLVGKELENMIKTVKKMSESVVGFRSTCDVQELHSLKKHGIELHRHLNNLNARFAVQPNADG